VSRALMPQDVARAGRPRWPGVKRREERCSAPALRHRVATAALTPRARRGIAHPLPPYTESAVQFSSLTFSTWE
jgi:hypothetical protein